MNSLTKTLLTILGLALLVAAGLWIFGGKKVRYSTSLVIDAPPSVVFPYLTDSELLRQWVDGVLEIDSLDNSQIQVGSVAEVTIREGDRQFRYRETVLRYDEDQLLSIRSENSVFSNTLIYKLTEKNGKTQLEFSIKKSRIGVGRMLALFSKDETQDRIDNDIRSLKKLIERNHKSVSSNRPSPKQVFTNPIDQRPTRIATAT